MSDVKDLEIRIKANGGDKKDNEPEGKYPPGAWEKAAQMLERAPKKKKRGKKKNG